MYIHVYILYILCRYLYMKCICYVYTLNILVILLVYLEIYIAYYGYIFHRGADVA